MNVDVKIPKWVLELPANANTVMNGAFIRLNQDIHKKAKENVYDGPFPLTKRSGVYKRALKMGAYKQITPNSAGEQSHYIDLGKKTGVPWAMVHEGTDGRFQTRIVPKKAKWLTFRIWNPGDTTKATGPWVRSKGVTIKIRPSINPAVQEMVPKFPQYLTETMAYLMRGKS